MPYQTNELLNLLHLLFVICIVCTFYNSDNTEKLILCLCSPVVPFAKSTEVVVIKSPLPHPIPIVALVDKTVMVGVALV